MTGPTQELTSQEGDGGFVSLEWGQEPDSANEMTPEARAELCEHGEASSTERPKEDFTGSE